jgi:hypothetical protein
MVGIIAVIPYSLTQQSDLLATLELPIPLPLLVAIQIGQNAVLFLGLVAVGLFLAARTGLGLPFVEGWLTKQPVWEHLPRTAALAAFLGVVSTLVIIGLDAFVFGPPLEAMLTELAIELPESISPPAWQGFLASFYGGVAEEVQLRLCVMTLLAWLGGRVSRDAEGRPTLAVLWIANVMAAVLFGLGHLPTAAALGLPMNALFVTRTVILNGLLAVVDGWLYGTRGLESAMIAHFSADIVLHVVLPLIA